MPEENFNQEEGHNQDQFEGGHEETPQKEESGKINAIAILSYLWLLFLIPLFAAKEDEFAQFHAKQGLVLFVISLIVFIPVIGWMLSPFVSLFTLVLAIIGIINVVNGKKKELPVIGQFAKKFNI